MELRQQEPRKRRSLRHDGVSIFERKRPGGAREWVFRWTNPQSRRVEQVTAARVGASNERERVDWAVQKSRQLADLRGAVENGTVGLEPLSLDDALAQYLARIKWPATLASRSRPLGVLVEFLRTKGVQSCQDITPVLLDKWGDRILGADLDFAPGTLNKWNRESRGFFSWLMRKKQLPRVTRSDLLEATKITRVPRETSIIRGTEVHRLLQAALRHDAATQPECAPLVLFLLLSGMRLGEALAMKWDYVLFDEALVSLPPDVTKTRSGREVTWTETPALGELLRAMSLRRKGARLFAEPRWWYERIPRVLAKRFGGPACTWHTLRRSCASVLASAPAVYGAGAAIRTARRCGHSLAIADRYYLKALGNLPATATTMEAALDIEALCKAIVASVNGPVDESILDSTPVPAAQAVG